VLVSPDQAAIEQAEATLLQKEVQRGDIVASHPVQAEHAHLAIAASGHLDLSANQGDGFDPRALRGQRCEQIDLDAQRPRPEQDLRVGLPVRARREQLCIAEGEHRGQSAQAQREGADLDLDAEGLGET
jgi:hypothetical protein